MYTEEFINEECTWWQKSHGNHGYLRDAEGVVVEPGFHLGYTWTYQCEQIPRLTHLHIIMQHKKSDEKAWAVDGTRYDTLQGAIDALSRPPLLTLLEFYAFMRLHKILPLDHSEAIDMVAGAVNPTPNFIDGRWSTASRAITGLRDKGILGYKDERLVRL